MAKQASGQLVVGVVVAVILLVSGGLVWYKNLPRSRVLSPVIRTDTGVMVLIPAGPFLHGEKLGKGLAPPFYIDETEVPNHVYARFCRTTGYALPPDFPADRPEHPVVNVSLIDAMAFAKWAGKRLPDPLEWEKAARGSDGRIFPWGSTTDRARANLLGPGLARVSTFAGGASPYRIFHMTGNAAEWVRITARPTPEQVAALRQAGVRFEENEPWYIVKGGSFRTAPDSAETWRQQVFPASYKAPDLGFRCARGSQQ